MKLVALTLLFFICFEVFAQRSYINRGDISFESYDYRQAIYSYNEALIKTKEPEVKQYLYGRLALCYTKLFQYTKAEEYFSMVMESGEDVKPELYVEYGHVLKLNGKYAEAKNQFVKYYESVQTKEAASYIQSVEWAMNNIDVVNNSYRIFLTNLDISGQSLGYCYYGSGLVYCHGRNKTLANKSRGVIFDLDYATNENNLEFTARKNFFPKINFEWNEISPSLTADESRMYFAANATRLKAGKIEHGLEVNPEGIANFKIYVAIKRDAEFQDIKELPFNNNEFSCMHPCIVNDGKVLIFSSDKPGGFGGFDLYKSTLLNDSIWGDPVNLGSAVNSAENEIFPWVNSNLLFFSSKGFSGYGGYDVFIAGLNDEWMPENLKNMGMPINSFRDDIAFITQDSGSSGYFSSNRNMDNGADQVYFFKEGKIGLLTFNSVSSFDHKNKLPVQLLDSITHLSLTNVENPQGEKKGYESARKEQPGPKAKQATIPDFRKEFAPILFKFNEASITHTQKVVADSLIALYKKNPNQRIRIRAYTDSRGSSQYNIALSNRRAASVKHYLVQKGVPQSKISTKGLGESELLNGCADGVECSENQHAINRRVLMILTAE